MSTHRFEGLTRAQTDTLSQIALNNDLNHHPRVLRVLEEKGYIEGHDVVLPGWPPVTIRAWTVPIPVHMRWCAWCAWRTSLPETEDEQRAALAATETGEGRA